MSKQDLPEDRQFLHSNSQRMSSLIWIIRSCRFARLSFNSDSSRVQHHVRSGSQHIPETNALLSTSFSDYNLTFPLWKPPMSICVEFECLWWVIFVIYEIINGPFVFCNLIGNPTEHKWLLGFVKWQRLLYVANSDTLVSAFLDVQMLKRWNDSPIVLHSEQLS